MGVKQKEKQKRKMVCLPLGYKSDGFTNPTANNFRSLFEGFFLLSLCRSQEMGCLVRRFTKHDTK